MDVDRRIGPDDRADEQPAMEGSSLPTELDGAVARGELEVQYQPIMDIRSGHLHGFEALVRWRHPQLGLLAPTEFIDLAEQTGSIIAIGAWVLDRACQQAQLWRASRPTLTMSVNISACQLEDQGLIGMIANALDRSGLDPRALVLEITESAAIRDIDAVIPRLEQLKRIGIGLAIDDLGTGYSSLTYLRRFPVDQIKIDRSFVSEVSMSTAGRTIVESLIALASALGIEVVAEGVETEHQLVELARLGCDLGQGFLWRRAEDAASVGHWLSQDLPGEGSPR